MDLNSLKSAVEALHHLLNSIVNLPACDIDKYRKQLGEISECIAMLANNPENSSYWQSIAMRLTDIISQLASNNILVEGRYTFKAIDGGSIRCLKYQGHHLVPDNHEATSFVIEADKEAGYFYLCCNNQYLTITGNGHISSSAGREDALRWMFEPNYSGKGGYGLWAGDPDADEMLFLALPSGKNNKIRLLPENKGSEQASIIAGIEGGFEQLFRPVLKKLKPFICLKSLQSDLAFLQAGHGISQVSLGLNTLFHCTRAIEKNPVIARQMDFYVAKSYLFELNEYYNNKQRLHIELGFWQAMVHETGDVNAEPFLLAIEKELENKLALRCVYKERACQQQLLSEIERLSDLRAAYSSPQNVSVSMDDAREKVQYLARALRACNRAIGAAETAHLAVYVRLERVSKLIIRNKAALANPAPMSHVLSYLALCRELYDMSSWSLKETYKMCEKIASDSRLSLFAPPRGNQVSHTVSLSAYSGL